MDTWTVVGKHSIYQQYICLNCVFIFGIRAVLKTVCVPGGSVPDFNIVIKPDREAEKQRTAEVGSVITADTISGGRLPWYPAATGCSLIGWPALVSQQYSVSFFHSSF